MLGIKIYNADGASMMMPLKSSSISLEDTMPAFDDNLEEGLFSLPIEAPMSSELRRFLNFPENFKTVSETIPDSWRCDVYDNGLIFLEDCELRLLSHSGRFDHREGTYRFNVSGIKGRYGALIKGKKLTDLYLGGHIIWDRASYDSRQFASVLMRDGLFPAEKQRIQFFPMVFEDYFDTSRSDYGGESIQDNTANLILTSNALPDGWEFGSNDGTNLFASGVAGYENHRTIPFFNLVYVLKSAFSEFGFEAQGTFFNLPDIDKVFIFNNCSVEKYDPLFPTESNNQIVPANHVPEISIYEFLAALQNFYNLKLIFLPGNKVSINLKEITTDVNSYKNFTPYAAVSYTSAERNPMHKDGFTLKFDVDSAEFAWSDMVKDPKDFNIIATVTLYTDIAGLSFAFPLEDTHYIYVEAENYYYQYSTQRTEWVPYSENLFEFKEGNGDQTFSIPITPLLEHYAVQPISGIVKSNVLMTRQYGSYMSGNYQMIRKPFGLRLFYGHQESAASYLNRPRSFSHNYNADGSKIATMSMSWRHKEGLYPMRWKTWIKTLQNSWDVPAQLHLNIKQLADLKETDVLQIDNNNFLIRKSEYELPLRDPVDVRLVKI